MSRSLRLFASISLFTRFAVILFSPQSARADKPPADPPKPVCCDCDSDDDSGSPSSDCPPQSASGKSFISLTEGNLTESYHVAQVRSAFGVTMDFKLVYNSYNADNSRTSLDTMVGFGWTHTYNEFLFALGSDMFRMRGDGRIVRYHLMPGGTYQTSPGYFETLVKNPDGSFDVTTKFKTRYHYQSIPNTPFLVQGPVLRLVSITDRNNNITTLSYTSGDLTAITDTYNRSFQLTYN